MELNKETLEKDPCNFCGKTLREQMKGCNEITCYRQFLHKQETLEEAAERLYPIPFPNKFSNMNQEAYKEREAFITGVKYNTDRDYCYEKFQNEQETNYLIEALKEIESICDNQNHTHENIWRVANNAIEQFKN